MNNLQNLTKASLLVENGVFFLRTCPLFILEAQQLSTIVTSTSLSLSLSLSLFVCGGLNDTCHNVNVVCNFLKLL